jgi:general secretion pathway protein L
MPADRDFVASAAARLRRSPAAAFGRWWARELAAILPESTKAAVQRRRLRPVVAFAEDGATVWQPSPRGREIGMDRVARIAPGDDAAGRAAMEALARRGGTPNVVIALPPQQVLRRTLLLPEALEENLRQAVGYDLDRHTPFRSDDLYFDVAVTDRDRANGQLRAELATARRTVVDRALETAERWGANVVAVVPDAPDTAAVSRLNLLPEERQPSRSAVRWPALLALAVLGITAAVAVALPIWQKREQAIALLRQADEARGQAAVSEGLRAELDRSVATYNFALERKFAFPPALQVVDEVTKLLPDDTWLTQLEVKTTARGKEVQRELLLRGESGNAGRLITLFEESKVFTQAAPRSPTTKIQPGPGEIFDLVAQLRPLPPRPPVALGAAAQAEATPPAGDAASPAAAPPAAAAVPAPATPPAAAAVPPPAPGAAPAAAPAGPAGPGPATPVKPAPAAPTAQPPTGAPASSGPAPAPAPKPPAPPAGANPSAGAASAPATAGPPVPASDSAAGKPRP